MDDSNNDGDVNDPNPNPPPIASSSSPFDVPRGGCLSQNFAMEYIYYWMEVDANDIDGASLLPPSSSSS